MATALASERIGIEYTSATLDPGDAAQSFIAGLLDTKRGTCANMPVLYLGIAFRLDWPVNAVVARDHMFCRWQDGDSYFNLEATNAQSEGGEASFATPSDKEYIEWLEVPGRAIIMNSDMWPLTRRQLLAVFLQQRAAYWAVHGEHDRAARDIINAHELFPNNRDIFMFLEKVLARKAGEILSDDEHETLLRWTRLIGRRARREMEEGHAIK